MKIDVCPVDDLQMSQGFAEALRLAKSARALRFFFFFFVGGGGGGGGRGGTFLCRRCTTTM